MLFNTVVKIAGNETLRQTAIRACTANYYSGKKPASIPSEETASLCTTANQVLEEGSIHMHQPKTGNDYQLSVTISCLSGARP